MWGCFGNIKIVLRGGGRARLNEPEACPGPLATPAPPWYLAHSSCPPRVPPMDRPYFVHASAYVDEPCEIGEGTKVWHFSHIMPKCKLGKRCILGQNVHVATGVVIGDNVKIQNNVSLYDGAVI